MVTIREATVADIDTLYSLITAIAEHHKQAQYVLTSKTELEQAGFSETPSFGALLAEVNGEIAGYCSYTWNYSIWLGATNMNIDDVFVWDKFRGQKVGEALMFKAKEVCIKNGASRIRWEVEQDNHRAIKFYQNLGAQLDIKGLFRWNLNE